MSAPTILFAAKPDRWPTYEPHLRRALAAAGISDANLTTQADPSDVDYIVYAPNSEVQDFTPYTKLKAVLNLWAGVENVTGNATLTAPLARMVDTGLTDGMVEWCVGHTLRHHLGMDTHIHGQDGIWRNGSVPPLARNRPVTVLGLGALGEAVAQALHGLGFPVSGWSRSPKSIANVTTHHGEEGLQAALSRAEIVILLLPDTPATENILNAKTLAALPEGAVLINPGRGPLIDDDALLAALDSGQIGHATLDVFRQEPLPEAHPFWAHPKITVTPHIASETRPETASETVAENIRRGEAGEPFLHLVDRNLGY
ncbi:2-hydroxyacid dehydrogenase [Gymnodinialimonas ceratoperidinii]|uniref:Glyoxylate/hydroxypyruvate reductase A n=1 Tax=Gymnodinialimonas ceratoperidinii TaxID=2856823 RepID=A0A8F6TY10_9RHOB|nr:glyoxylate/hydroxypyruvate reductase A [Gymnodinialimonas ceratoperidinii]QXT40543.1 glyoxylate/hydroxypyruvate reductase A [Gymnodinialimonas ceratoperidinii]